MNFEFKEFRPAKIFSSDVRYFSTSFKIGKNEIRILVQFDTKSGEVFCTLSESGPPSWLDLTWEEAEELIGRSINT